MYNCEHTPVKDVPPQEKQSRHLVRTERNDAPENALKAVNSFGETERHERSNPASDETRRPKHLVSPNDTGSPPSRG
jgi:hypothetical protein